jgi:hypothetical protein
MDFSSSLFNIPNKINSFLKSVTPFPTFHASWAGKMKGGKLIKEDDLLSKSLRFDFFQEV